LPLITEELADAERRVKRFNSMMSQLAQGTNAMLTQSMSVPKPAHLAEEKELPNMTPTRSAEAVTPKEPSIEQDVKVPPNLTPTRSPVAVTEFEIIPEAKASPVAVNKPVQRRTGPRMFNFGFTINPINPVNMNVKNPSKR
jgi:hypothetical protein